MPENRNRSVFVIGDSISMHYGPYLEKLLEGKFGYSRKRGIKKIDQSIDDTEGDNGGDSSKVLEYLVEQSGKNIVYDILLINCGLHDIKTDTVLRQKQIDIKEYEKNLFAIVSLAKKISDTVIWIRSTPVNDDIHNSINHDFYRYNDDLTAYNLVADKVMKKQNVPSIDLYGFTKDLGDRITIDHVHYNDRVRKSQAEFIAQYLIERY